VLQPAIVIGIVLVRIEEGFETALAIAMATATVKT
jgi:hypothetical protein